MEDIKSCYNYLIANFPQFAEFIEQQKHLSIDELINNHNLTVIKEQD